MKKKDKKKNLVQKKKKYLLFFSVSILLLLLGSFPIVQDKLELRKVEKKVYAVNQLFQGKVSLKSAKKLVSKTVDSNKSLDFDVQSYLKDLISSYEEVDSLLNDSNYTNLLKVDNFVKEEDSWKEKEELLNHVSSNLKRNVEKIEEIISVEIMDGYSNHKYYSQVMESLNKKAIKNYLLEKRNLLKKIDFQKESFQYLKEHSDDWEVVDQKIVFLKRVTYNEYSSIAKDKEVFSFTLIEDTVSPEIVASDLTIYLNQTVDVSSKVQCVDAVDGEVECKIEGSYDNTKIGDYPYTITSIDTAGNTSSRTITIHVRQKIINQKPYYIEVLRNQNVVIVYGLDENGDYTKVVKVFVCSTGKDNATPTGTFSTTHKYEWRGLFGGVYGQYATRIVDHILFHSVPYYSMNKGDLEWEEYNKLGTQASLGCVRLAVRDVKWIYDNCPVGTTVKIYDGNIPAGISKPSAIKIDGTSPNRGWDPTDPDGNNPWR